MKVYAAIAGVRFVHIQLMFHSPINTWQLLDLRLLKTDLFTSLLNLHANPPLYNLWIGLLLHLPGSMRVPVAETVYFAAFLLIGVLTYLTMVLLAVPRIVALLVTTLLVVLDPAQVLYASELFYTTPIAFGMTASAYCAVSFLRSPTAGRAAWLASSLAYVSLLVSAFQPLEALAILVVIALAVPSLRRTLVRGAWLPSLLMALWILHMTISFGTPTTSTWLGMNLAHPTIGFAPPGEVQRLVDQGKLSRQALAVPFGPLWMYGVAPNRVGPEALTQVTKANGQPNLNNRAYIDISKHSLKNDLRFIRIDPVSYLKAVRIGAAIGVVPSDEYFFFSDLKSMTGYRTFYDRFVLLQPSRYDYASFLYLHRGPSPSQVSWTNIAELLAAGTGIPIVVALSWRKRRRYAMACAVPWTMAGAFLVVTTLTDVGENNRFHFESGTIVISLATVATVTAWRWGSQRWRPNPSRTPLGDDLNRLGWNDPAGDPTSLRPDSNQPTSA